MPLITTPSSYYPISPLPPPLGDVPKAVSLAAQTNCVEKSYHLAEFHAQRAVNQPRSLFSSILSFINEACQPIRSTHNLHIADQTTLSIPPCQYPLSTIISPSEPLPSQVDALFRLPETEARAALLRLLHTGPSFNQS